MATIDIRGATLSAADPPIATNPNPDLAIKAPVRVATTGSNITLSGLQTIDGVTLAAGDRVLVKDQTDQTTNGLYNATTGPWTRTIDANNNSQFTQGSMVAVAAGTTNANGLFRLTTANPITLGTSLLAWSLLTAPLVVSSLGIIPAASSLSTALQTLQSLSGTAVSSFNANSILITSDNVNIGSGFVNGLNIAHNYGGATAQGGRQTLNIQSNFTAATSASNPNRNYVGVTIATQALASDGGTIGGGNEKGGFFAINPVAQALAGATGLLGVTAGEADIAMQAGSSARNKFGWSIVQLAADAVQGSTYDAALGISSIAGASVGWKNGILFSASNGQWPFATTATILGTADGAAKTIGSGIDLSGIGTITNFAFKSKNFSVDGVGGLVATACALSSVAISTPLLSSAWLAMAAGTTAIAQINFAASTAPTSPNNGDWWFDGTNLNIRISGSTKTINHS